MDDLEIVRLCAEAMGGEVALHGNDVFLDGDYFRPLDDDAQAMALLKRCGLTVNRVYDPDGWYATDYPGNRHEAIASDLNRAICECVAKLTPLRRGG